MATKEEIRLQKEYNDALKLSSSVTSGILADIKEMVGLKTKLGKSLQSEVSSLQSSEDIQAQIVKNEDRIKELSSVTAKNKVKRAQKDIESLKTINKSLSAEAQMVDIIKKVDEEAQNLSNSLSSGLDGFVDDIKSIPVFGKMFGRFGDYASGILKNKIGAAAQTFTTTFATNIRAGQTAMTALGGAGSAAGSSLVAAFSGPQAIIAAIVVAIGAAVFAFYKLSEATKAFREETGLLNSQTQGLEQNIINVSKTTASLGASTQDVAKAAAEFTNTFDGLEQPSQAVLSSIVTLNKNFGVSVTEATKLNKIFQNIGDLTADQAQILIGQTASMADLAGVAPDKVIKDMADNSELAYKYFGGSVEELRNAAISAAKLGTSLAEAGKVSDNLLDFESSITKELEASVMLGQSLNFGQARYLAATKDVLGAQQAVLDEVMKLGDLNQLSVFEQEALVEASGMTLDSLINQQRIRERFGRLNKEDLASALSLVEAGKDITKLSEADLKNQTEELAKQKQIQSEFDNMKNQLSAVGTDLLMALAPIGKLLVELLVPVMSLLKGIFEPIGNALRGVSDALQPIRGMMTDIFGEGDALAGIFEFIGKIISAGLVFAINLFSNKLKTVMTIVSGIYDVFKGIITGDFSLILDGIMSIGEGVLRYFKTIPMVLLDTFLDIFPSIGEAFESLASKIKGFFIDMLPGWASRLLGGNDMGQSSKQNESMSTSGPSINDGVVQNGQVVSTHPEDFLIATKNPAQLANSVGGGGVPMISMDGVIAELRELKAAFLSNKDVYMDSTKVTTIVRRKTETSSDNKFGTQFA